MEKDILVPLQQEEGPSLKNPKQEHLPIIEKDLEKFYRKLIQCKEQGWSPRGGEYVIVLSRWNCDLDSDDE